MDLFKEFVEILGSNLAGKELLSCLEACEGKDGSHAMGEVSETFVLWLDIR